MVDICKLISFEEPIGQGSHVIGAPNYVHASDFVPRKNKRCVWSRSRDKYYIYTLDFQELALDSPPENIKWAQV